MKKILMTMFIVTFLALAMAGSALAAGTSFTGSTFMSYGTYASIIVNTSSNVFLMYNGDSTNAQSYGAFTKNKAGDKYYATGGGQGALTGIYFKQSDTFVGKLDFPNMTNVVLFSDASGWTAQ